MQRGSGQGASYKPRAKSTAAQRESEGTIVLTSPAQQNAGGGKGPCGGHAARGGNYLHRGPSVQAMERVLHRVKEWTGRTRDRVKDVRVIIRGLNAVPRGWGNHFRTGTAARKSVQVDDYVFFRLRRFMGKRKGRNLRAGEADQWSRDFFVNGHGLHRLRGRIRYPEAA